MEPVTFNNSCPGVPGGLPAYLITQLIRTLLSSQCLFGNPKDYPKDAGEKLSSDSEFDFIVVGGGSAGSVIASRLSEVETWKVLLLEAGDTPSFESEIPGFTFSSYGTRADWSFKNDRDEKSCLSMEDKSCVFAKGKSLGGSSNLNLMHYIRGNAEDFDEWKQAGNPGWGFSDVLPYFKKSERLHAEFTFVNDTDYDGDIRAIRKIVIGNEKRTYEFSKMVPGEYHGRGGPLPVNHFSYDFYLSTLKMIYCQAVNEIGLDCISDVNGSNQTGFVHAMGTVVEGARANVAKVFLGPAKSRSNLFVARNVHVRKVITRGNSAVGVELSRAGSVMNVYAKKEVIVSAGVFNSPKILLLSGIGPADHLSEMGIPLVKELPGVGENLQSHVTFFGLPISVEFEDSPVPMKTMQKYDGMYEFLTRGSGIYGNLCMNDLIGFVGTEEGTLVPDLELIHFLNHWGDTYLFDDMFRALGFGHDIINQLANFTSHSKVMLSCPTVLKPKSRGTVRLKSADKDQPPKIAANLLAEDEDVAVLLRGIRLAVKLARTKSFEAANAEILELDVPECRGLLPDDRWVCLVRHMSTALNNFAGTCKMGPETDGAAVVDHSLKVHGMRGLRVADSSIMPTIVRGSTHITAIMIGEKVSDLIKNEWESEGVHEEL